MLRLLADENVHGPMLKALRDHSDSIDLVRVADVGLRTNRDDVILEWAGANQRMVLTHDRSSMIGLAYRRLADGAPMPGVFVVTRRYAIAEVARDLVLISECALPGEFENRVTYLPLR
jgi:predicted nuclease of predicted toxin-antitoxin system